jgi:hypothetical protein
MATLRHILYGFLPMAFLCLFIIVYLQGKNERIRIAQIAKLEKQVIERDSLILTQKNRLNNALSYYDSVSIAVGRGRVSNHVYDSLRTILDTQRK